MSKVYQHSNLLFKLPPPSDPNYLKIEIAKKWIAINNSVFYFNKIRTFQNEVSSSSDFGLGADVYLSENYVCIEGNLATSGTGDRYTPVYLISPNKSKGFAFKLSSLFNSCYGIQEQESGNLSFLAAEYRVGVNDVEIESGGKIFYSKEIEGVNFTKFYIKDKSLTPTKEITRATFIDPENVFKFFIE
jgi:hypothetical protein